MNLEKAIPAQLEDVLSEEIEKYLEADGGHHIWIGIKKDNEARLMFGDKWKFGWAVHRVVWLLNHGKLPKGMHLYQMCDRKFCVNVDHYAIGRPGLGRVLGVLRKDGINPMHYVVRHSHKYDSMNEFVY